MQIKLGRSSSDPTSVAGGVHGVVYRGNRSVQTVPGGTAVDFQNNSKWDAFEVDFDRSNTIECAPGYDRRVRSGRAGAGSCGIRVHNLTGGVVAPTIVFAPVGVRSSGKPPAASPSPPPSPAAESASSPTLEKASHRSCCEAPTSRRPSWRRGFPSRGAHRLIDCEMIVHGYRLADEAQIISSGADLRDGEWNVFAAGSGLGLVLALRVEMGSIARDLLAPGEGYLGEATGAFLLDAPPRGEGRRRLRRRPRRYRFEREGCSRSGCGGGRLLSRRRNRVI